MFAIDSARLFRYHPAHKADVQNPRGRSKGIRAGDGGTGARMDRAAARQRADAHSTCPRHLAGSWVGGPARCRGHVGRRDGLAAAKCVSRIRRRTDGPAGLRPGCRDGGAVRPISAVIPYKNPKALIAYYLAIFSLIPCLGIPLGIAALVLGILGLKAAKAHPQAHGQVHAWVGIILGSLCAASNIVALVVVLVSASGPGAGLVWWSLGENHESLKAAANTQLRTVLRMSLVSHGKIKS